MTPTAFVAAHGDPKSWTPTEIEAYENVAGIHHHRVTLTKDAVTLYDIGTNTVSNRVSHREGEADLEFARELGDTLQEYDTTDRHGRPLRVVLQLVREMYGTTDADPGAVYEFAS